MRQIACLSLQGRKMNIPHTDLLLPLSGVLFVESLRQGLAGVFITNFNQQPVSLPITCVLNYTSDLELWTGPLRAAAWASAVERRLERRVWGSQRSPTFAKFSLQVTVILWKHWKIVRPWAGLRVCSPSLLKIKTPKFREICTCHACTHVLAFIHQTWQPVGKGCVWGSIQVQKDFTEYQHMSFLLNQTLMITCAI